MCMTYLRYPSSSLTVSTRGVEARGVPQMRARSADALFLILLNGLYESQGVCLTPLAQLLKRRCEFYGRVRVFHFRVRTVIYDYIVISSHYSLSLSSLRRLSQAESETPFVYVFSLRPTVFRFSVHACRNALIAMCMSLLQEACSLALGRGLWVCNCISVCVSVCAFARV